MTHFRHLLTASILVLTTLAQVQASDWYNWRGPWQTGASPEKDLPSTWSPDPKAKDNNLVWKAAYGSRSTPLVMNGRVYLINYISAGSPETIQERVMCLDADTGEFKWQHNFNVFHTDIVTSRLGWTNLAGDPKTGNIYAHGTQGLFFCFNKDGKVLWQRSLTEEYGRVTGYGGRVTSPIVAEDLVIIGMLNAAWGDFAKGGNRFLAMNKLTGEVVWWSAPAGQPKDTYYSVPVVATINGQALVITGSSDGSVIAMKLRTGEKVWAYPFARLAVNCSPVVDGSLVYIAHGEESPGIAVKGRIICLDASKIVDGKPALVWKKDGVMVRYCSPIVHGGRLYVADEGGNLHCFEAKSGNPLWGKRGYHYSGGSQGSPVWADGKIYVSEVASKFYILEPGDKQCKKLHEHTFDGEEISSTPAVANGRVYFTTGNEIYCIGKKGAKPAPEPPIYAGPTAKATDKIAALQVVPADVVAYPGDTVKFKVRAFDVNGNFIREMEPDEVQWFLPNPVPPPTAKTPPPPLDGDIEEAGVLIVSKSKPSQQGYVTALLPNLNLSARARVRIVPRLPYVQDFTKVPNGAVPAGWVNTQGKFVVKTLKDGNKVLAKVNDNANPLIAKGNAFIGPPTMKDYTVECDIMGTNVGDKAVQEWSPDMGIGVNRYTLVIAGGIQKLRIVSWDVLPRIDKTIPFDWKPGVWYRLKLTVDIKGNEGAVKGKIWQRDEKEPADWTITVTDPRPNLEGSPTLFGFVQGVANNAGGTEILYDNLRISANKK